MSDFVIVPAWRRADFLHACLSRLAVADDGNARYLIAMDRKGDLPRNTLVVNAFARLVGEHRVTTRVAQHHYHGNSYNILTAYALAVNTHADLVHLVEEDVFVGSDYLSYAREAHALVPAAFAVSACQNQNLLAQPDPNPGAVYLDPAYQSLAVSFTRETLRLVLREAREAYYRNPVQYCRRRFPKTKIPAANAEQDGLLHRVAEERGLSTVYPCSPRAYHAGFIGYHRDGEPLAGTDMFARGRELLAMGTAELNRRAHSYPDHAAIDLDEQRGKISEVVHWR